MLLIDDFLTKDDYDWVSNNQDTIMQDSGGTYKWWDGWWKKKANNIQQFFIQIIHTKYNPLKSNYGWDLENNKLDKQLFPNGVMGFEYWTNNYSSKKGGEWHVNCDEKVKHEQQKYINPPFGVIYYITAPASGGELYISNKNCKEYSTPWDDQDKYGNDFTIIKPVANRLIITDPSYWHRVLPFPETESRATFIHDIWHTRITTADAEDQGYSIDDFK